MNIDRAEKIQQLALRRQLDFTVVLENVDDPHNIGAILRTCDAVGVAEIYVLYSREGLQNHKLELGKRSSAGARKWVNVQLFRDVEACFAHVKQRYAQVYGTHLGEGALSLYELELNASTALVFGNEAEGLSQAALAHCHGNFHIPQMGMAQSLNVSVACAVSLYEALRQRQAAGRYELQNDSPAHLDLWQEYQRRHEEHADGRKTLGE
jgi:tRNA (guanosine-2'-O-)-methyltransferase